MIGQNTDSNYRKILEGISIKTLVHGSRTLMSKFLLTKNSKLPQHKHPYEQTGYLVSGKITLYIGTVKYDVNAGGSWCIPENIEHNADIIENSVALEIFSPLREDYLKFLDDESKQL